MELEKRLVKRARIQDRDVTIDSWSESPSEQPYRWRNEGLESLPRRLSEHLVKALKSKEPLVAATAAIGLARSAKSANSELVEVIRNPKLPQSTRQAGAETLSVTASRSTYLGVYDELSDPKSAAYSSAVHAELTRGLAFQGVDAMDPRWLRAVASGKQELELAALQGWEQLQRGDLPDAAQDLLNDPRGVVRAAALRAFAACEGDAHLETVLEAMRSPTLEVRMGAIRSLGYMEAPQAHTELSRLLQDESTGVRAEAIRSLSRLRDYASVDIAASTDDSWRVRLAAVDSLRKRDDPGAMELALQLVSDRNPQVQMAALQAIQDWPAESNGPAYFQALSSDSLQGRTFAAKSLSANWPTAMLFAPSASSHQRQRQLKMLKQLWPFGGLEPRPATDADLEQLNRWIANLTVEDLEERRFAAKSIARVSRRTHLPDQAIEVLATRIPSETDSSTRRDIARAATSRPNQQIGLALAQMLQHSDRQIRLLAFEYIQQNGDVRNRDLIREQLNHSDRQIQIAAIATIGEVGDRQAETRLIRKLGDVSPEIRTASAVALCRIGSVSGAAALERFAVSTSPAIRRMAAEAMGDVGEQVFVARLVVMLEDDDKSVIAAANSSLQRIARENGASVSAQLGADPASSRSFIANR